MTVFSPRKLPLLPLARATIACAFLGTVVAVARAEWRPLPAALAARRLRIDPDSTHWLDPPGLGFRRALTIAREGDQSSDVYAVSARTGPLDRIIELRDVSNLTRSPNADEGSLVVDGHYAAFTTRVAGQTVAFTVMDTAGERPRSSRGFDARIRGAITRLQQTGSVRGYRFDRFDLVTPSSHATIAFEGQTLAVRAGSNEIRVDRAGPSVSVGAQLVRERPRHAAEADNWLTWTVDTVRALPWVGSKPIAWAEALTFRAKHVVARARVVAAGDNTRREVAEDLADVLNIRSTGELEGSVEHWPPPALHGSVEPVIEHEGEWSPVAQRDDPFVQTNPGAPPPMYITFVRTDRERPDVRVYLVVWDPRQIEIHSAPGSQEPMGATGETGSGAIPRDERTLTRLVAGFNGGFQGLHGEFGLYAEGALLLPPKPYAATVALMADGTTAFGSWPPDQREVPADIVELRQNLTALVDQGTFNPWHRDDWGAVQETVTDLRTARSGLCLTSEGYVVFLWGDNLQPRALGNAMLSARCTYGMHLDMNGPNTGFEFYRVARHGTLPPLTRRLTPGYEVEGTVDEAPDMDFRGRKLVRAMPHRAPRYINRNPRDFLYILLRPVLPGPPLHPPIEPAQPGEGAWHVAGLGDTPFPWPMARTRIRPDAARPDRWVNLVRIDARRVALAPPDASVGVVARVVGATIATGANEMRISMTEGSAGARWSIGVAGDGIAGEALRPGMEVLRGACVDADGYLVMAVADRALPDLVSRALDAAGCTPERIALQGTSVVLPSGETAAGESAPTRATPVLTLVTREFPLARQIFPEVTPVARAVWSPLQSQRVRYFPNPGNHVTVQVRLSGQAPMVLRLPGLPNSFFSSAYPDGGIPPAMPAQSH